MNALITAVTTLSRKKCPIIIAYFIDVFPAKIYTLALILTTNRVFLLLNMKQVSKCNLEQVRYTTV